MSARGWHGVQLAVIGFIGLCGVLHNGRPENPMWLQVLAGILVLAALAVACGATFLVARVAWPLYGGREAADPDREGARLRRGLVLTFTAVVMLALGTASSWWPEDGDGADAGAGLLVVEARNGERWCGALRDAGPGRLAVSVDGRAVVVALGSVAEVEPVDRC